MYLQDCEVYSSSSSSSTSGKCVCKDVRCITAAAAALQVVNMCMGCIAAAAALHVVSVCMGCIAAAAACTTGDKCACKVIRYIAAAVVQVVKVCTVKVVRCIAAALEYTCTLNWSYCLSESATM